MDIDYPGILKKNKMNEDVDSKSNLVDVLTKSPLSISQILKIWSKFK